MSTGETIKSLFNKKQNTSTVTDTTMGLETSPTGAENPYLAARRSWNDHVGAVMTSRQTWQVMGILCLMIALASVGGIIHIGSQSKFIPYIIEVDKLGQALAVSPAQLIATPDQRVVHSAVASFINDARIVTPDIALQRKAVFRVYSMLSANDPATAKANEWFNSTEESSPFTRATKETVSIEINSVIPQTPDTWQVDWIEIVNDRQGIMQGEPFRMRALVTVYTIPSTPQTTEEQVRMNPLGIYVRDFSWSKQP
ncbi:MAG: conjugal transfer protein TrbF [Methylococcaceae bacterium]|jgi:type IV secretion system protein VirB5